MTNYCVFIDIESASTIILAIVILPARLVEARPSSDPEVASFLVVASVLLCKAGRASVRSILALTASYGRDLDLQTRFLLD